MSCCAEQFNVATGRDVALGNIRSYVVEHDLTGEQMAAIFEAGLASAMACRPGWFGRHRPNRIDRTVSLFLSDVARFSDRFGYDGVQLAMIFDAGVGPAASLRPDLFAPTPSEAKAA